MIKRDSFWIWGQDPGTHHKITAWNIPGVNKMDAAEGAKYLGIPNICRIAMGNLPEPPFDGEMDKLTDFPKVAWSIIGDSDTTRTSNGGSDIDEVMKLADKYPNLVGGVMDDFFSYESRRNAYTPDVLHGYAEKLHSKGLDLWSVIYEREIVEEYKDRLNECDIVSMWTWRSENINNLEENLEKLEKLLTKGQKIFAGCYLWDYGNCGPIPMELMKKQVETYARWIEDGRIHGIIVCSNCVADVGLDTAEYIRSWIAENTY